jgi:hypothetical protein
LFSVPGCVVGLESHITSNLSLRDSLSKNSFSFIIPREGGMASDAGPGFFSQLSTLLRIKSLLLLELSSDTLKVLSCSIPGGRLTAAGASGADPCEGGYGPGTVKRMAPKYV